MKRLLPFLLLILPFLSQAQQNWTRILPDLKSPKQLVATKDGHYLVLDSEEEPWEINGATDGPSLSKFSADGSLIWQRTYLHTGSQLTAQSIFLMQNGNIWLTGKAAHKGYPRHLLSRIEAEAGDTAYMHLHKPDSLLFKYRMEDTYSTFYEYAHFYLQPTPSGDRFYKISGIFTDYAYTPLRRITEDNTLLSFHDGHEVRFGVMPEEPAPRYVVSPSGNVIFDQVGLQLTPEGGIITWYYGGRAAFPLSGGGILYMVGKNVSVYNAQYRKTAEVPYASYSPVEAQETIAHLEPTTDGFLMSGYYHPENASGKALFLMKLNLQGQLIWKRHYPEEAGTELVDMLAAEDGTAVLLLKNQQKTRLVKTNGQRLTLHNQPEVSRQALGVTLFPNPTHGNNLTLTFQKPFSGMLALYDQTGRLQLTQDVEAQTQHQMTLPTSLAPGIYQLLLRDSKGDSQSIRFIKQ